MSKKKIILGLIQSSVTKDIINNFQMTTKKIEEAANQGAQIICLQELFKTTYFPQNKNIDASKLAESIPGSSTRVLSNLAANLNIVIIAPLYEKSSKRKYFNTAVVIDADGKILGKYRKSHIPHDPFFYEKNYFTEGKSRYPVFRTKYALISVLICYDQWFPEAARICALKGAEIIIYPTAIGWIRNYNTSEGDWKKSWELIQRSHAIANGVHVASVNRVGIENKIEFWGGSFVCDSFGNVLKKANHDKEEILISEVDLSMNKKIQADWGFLKNRRPDSYKRICGH
tara:strand:+ start:1005 stop:1862 length:858 start_codon:yes stop_codon:yes gene_type:complete